MSDIVWVSGAIMDPSLILKLDADIVIKDESRAIKAYWAIQAGEPLDEGWFPKEVWADDEAGVIRALPDLFCVNGYWVVSKPCADVLLHFELGRGALYPVKIFQHDRTTPVEGEFFSLSFGNQKTALVKDQSPKLRDANLGDNSWLLPFVLKDGDLTVTPQTLDGPDLWIDTGVRRAIFGSDRLAKALKATGLATAFRFKACRIGNAQAEVS